MPDLPTPSPDASPALPSIDGLDTQRGLHFFAGRRALYLRSLQQFVDLYGSALPGLEAWLSAAPGADRGAALREVHAVGGVAASLGATRLERQARQVDALQRQPAADEPLHVLLAGFRDELTALIGQLRERLPRD